MIGYSIACSSAIDIEMINFVCGTLDWEISNRCSNMLASFGSKIGS